MGWGTRLVLGPVFFVTTSLAWWGFEMGSGWIAGGLRAVWVGTYYGVFWGGWAAIPVLGLAALLGGPFLPRRAWAWARWGFGAWLMAWLGVLASVLLLGAPDPFLVGS